MAVTPSKRGFRRNRPLELASAVLSVCLLAGCSIPALSYTEDEWDLPACAPADPIPAEELDQQTDVTCSIDDTEIVFADAARITVRAAGTGALVTSTTDGVGPEYGWIPVGADGLVVWKKVDGIVVEWHGTAAGIQRVKDAFGDNHDKK